MRLYASIAVVVLAVLGLYALLDLQRRHDIGRFATSPQELEIPLGARRIAAGGRALLGAVDAGESSATLELACRGEAQRFEAELGVDNEPVCGVTVALLAVLDADGAVLATTNAAAAGESVEPQRVVVRAAWDEDAVPVADEALPSVE